tara:strand:- start:3215 stop:3754 length:540 start_codon:yes stop_codon:yes gene_type:complete
MPIIRGTAPTAEGGTGTTKTYWFYAADTATNPADGGAKIVHGAGATNTYLTNNNLGGLTSSYNPESNANLWNPSTNRFDFTSLKIGDILDFRIDWLLDHAAAQELNLVFDLAEGQASPYTRNITHEYYKTAEIGVIVTSQFKLPIISQSTVDGSGRIRFESIVAANIVVAGIYYEVTEV